MNYKEYYKLIENDLFYKLPEQAIIDNDERVALAIIKNYRNKKLYTEYEYDEYNKYNEINFNEILSKYKNNRLFWEKTNIKRIYFR